MAAIGLRPHEHGSEGRSRLGRICQGLAYAAVISSIVPLTAPIFLPGFIAGHDAGAHQTYAFLFNRALLQGQLPVRWVEGIGDGLGQPLFNYYQVGFYYLVALVHQAGPSLSAAFKLTIAAQWAAGSLFMFLLCRPLGRMPAALAAAIFLWSPYLLLVAYVRTAYPELTAIGFAPGVLWALDRVLRTGRPFYICALAVTTGLLLVSHLPTALLVTPVAAAWLVGFCIAHPDRVGMAGRAAAGALLGAGLAAFYVLPAILELDAVGIRRLTTGYFDYHKHFVQPAWWFDWSWGYGGSGTAATDRMSVQIGIAQWIVLAASLVVLALPPLRRRASTPVWAAGWLAVASAALVMMTPASALVWEAVAPLAFIQFPWRLLVLATLACSVLAAVVLSTIRQPIAQALLVICAVIGQWYVTAEYRTVASTRERAAIAIDDPGWASTLNAQKWAFREPAYDPISVGAQNPIARGRWRAGDDGCHVMSASVADARLDLRLRAEAPLTLSINAPYFPGWRVRLDGRTVDPEIASPSGYMKVRLPAGVHRVEAVFGDTRVRAAAEAVTLASGAVWLTLASWPAWLFARRAARSRRYGAPFRPAASSRLPATARRTPG